MYNNEREDRRLYVASLSEDLPNLSFGELIPRETVYSAPTYSFTPRSVVHKRTVWYARPVLLMTLSVIMFAISIGSASYSILRGENSVAAPIVSTIELPPPEPLNYGLVLDHKLEDSFTSEKETLLASRAPFLVADLIDMELQYYYEGEVVDTAVILSKGDANSWWHVPAGSYTVDQFKKSRYSTFGNITMPWSISFDGNYYINGIPTYSDGSAVPEEYHGGGLRLSDEDAIRFYEQVELETAILVRERRVESDNFLYTARVEGVHAREYMIADVESNTVLAASNIDAPLPIASLTKLMTALIAAEEMKLDQNVELNTGAPFVTTLIPRLEGTYTVSMYSLLQLLMMESSNEAAEVIALEYGREAFIERMNTKAEEIGLTNTTFADPSGLHEGNVSSLSDLFRLTQYILNNRGFILELTNNQHLPTAYTNGQFGTLANFNRIDDVNFIAGKVGETEAAGQTSISLHTLRVDGVERVIEIVVLGTDQRSADVKHLFEYTKSMYE